MRVQDEKNAFRAIIPAYCVVEGAAVVFVSAGGRVVAGATGAIVSVEEGAAAGVFISGAGAVDVTSGAGEVVVVVVVSVVVVWLGACAGFALSEALDPGGTVVVVELDCVSVVLVVAVASDKVVGFAFSESDFCWQAVAPITQRLASVASRRCLRICNVL